MAQIEDQSSGRKAVVDVNIVPFIDLMSVLIIFLLITAVWTQVSMIQLGSSIYGKQQEGQQEIKLPSQAEIPFRLDIKRSGYRIFLGAEREFIAKKGSEYNSEDLLKYLEKVAKQYTSKKDVVVTMEDDLAYEHLVSTMDTLLESGFYDISIATAAGGP